MKTLNGSYVTRQGFVIAVQFADRQSAEQALARLDASESLTRQVAPTDSGDVRFNYNAEARVIRNLLA